MEPRLVPLNAVLALLRGDGGWPAPLRDQGFACERLELPVTTSKSNVTVDVLAHDNPARCVLPVEAKSGANIELPQARKYLAIDVAAIGRILTLPAAGAGTVVQPLFACLEAHEGRIRLGLAQVEAELTGYDSAAAGLVRCALLVVGDANVHLEVPPGSPLQPFDIEVPGPPPRVVPFDADSPDEELREPLITAIVAAMAQGQDRVSVNDLLGRILPSIYARGARQRLRRRAEQMLRGLAEREFKRHFDVVRGGPDIEGRIVRIRESPIAHAPQGQTQGWQALQRRAYRSVRGRAAPVIPGQGTFDLLRRETEAGEED